MATAKNCRLACWRGVSLALIFAWVCGWVCLLALPLAYAEGGAAKASIPKDGLLTAKQGRAIVAVALDLIPPSRRTLDCSHLIHAIYENAGFDYAYQSSLDLYAGASEQFARVKAPHAGDLIVWPGHVGIVVNPSHHSFYSLVRTGAEQQDYEGPYWRSRGTPRFYRYKITSISPRSAGNAELR